MAVGASDQLERHPARPYSFARPTQGGAQVRGSLAAPVQLFVRNYFGAHRWDEFLKRLDPIAAQVLRGEFQALSWYPFVVISSAVDAMVAMRSEAADDTLRKLSHHNLDRATNLIFKAIFKVGSPEFMVGKSDQVWKKYYSTGSMRVREAARGSAVVQLLDFPEMTQNYNKVVLYAIEAVIVKAGGRITELAVTRDIHRGDDMCEYSYRWA
ncbi:MAG TPA: hypothetical protein VK540_27890 [Polyangiaceae bacterium]|nr:hypothetical protein [Polyangiaceae bacterium]